MTSQIFYDINAIGKLISAYSRFQVMQELLNGGMCLHSPAGYREFLKTAGYEAIEVHEVAEKNWISAVGNKTELPSGGKRNEH